jgi:hypothetical protein
LIKVFFDDVSLVAEAKDKIPIAMGSEDFHDVPENWAISYHDHGLGLELGFFLETSTYTTA